MTKEEIIPYISRTLELMLKNAFGSRVKIFNYVPYIDRINQTDTGLITARFSADLVIQVDDGPTYEAYIMRSLFDMIEVRGGVEARIKLVIETDGTPKNIAASQRINARIAQVHNQPIRLLIEDIEFINNLVGETAFSQRPVEKRLYVE